MKGFSCEPVENKRERFLVIPSKTRVTVVCDPVKQAIDGFSFEPGKQEIGCACDPGKISRVQRFFDCLNR